MKQYKTLKIKIGKLSKNKQEILDYIILKNMDAINFCLKKAKNGYKITHNSVYYDLRKMNLPAAIACSAREKSIEIINLYNEKKGNKTFPIAKKSAVRYNNQVVKLIKTNHKLYKYFISLLYQSEKYSIIDNRIALPLIINSNYQKDIFYKIGNQYKLGSTELIKKNNDFYVYISYSKDINIPIPDNSFSPIGIDIGINNLAVSVAQSSVKFYKGNKIKWKNEFFRKQKTLLQRNFAIQKIKKLKGRQTRYNNFQINNIAKQIIIQAKKEIKPVIIMEDLKNILMTTKTNKKQRIQLHNWVFRKIQYAIHYKANWEGIPVMYINPYHTSQICSKCGELNKRNKHIYKCKNCGFECNADYNAGRNLQKIFLARCQKEQVLINNTSNCNIPEFKFLKDIRVRNSQINGGEILC